MSRNRPTAARQRCLKVVGAAVLVIAALALTSVGEARAAEQAAPAATPPPQRIASINLCTDQLLLWLVPPSRIAAVSSYAVKPLLSAYADRVQRLPAIPAEAERVIAVKPDLVLAGRYSNPATVRILRRLGYPLLLLPPARSFPAILDNLKQLERGIGATSETRKRIGGLAKALASLEKAAQEPSKNAPLAAAYQSNSYISGRGSLLHAALRAAGFQTLGDRLGLDGVSRVSLERLVAWPPDYLIERSRAYGGAALAYQLEEHPAFLRLVAKARRVMLPEKFLICGSPAILKAVARLRAARAGAWNK